VELILGKTANRLEFLVLFFHEKRTENEPTESNQGSKII